MPTLLVCHPNKKMYYKINSFLQNKVFEADSKLLGQNILSILDSYE